MQDKFTAEPVQYALGQPASRTGVAGFSMKATIILGIGFLSFLLAMLAGGTKLGFFLILPATAVGMALVSVNWRNRSIAEVAHMVWLARKNKKSHENEYVAGSLSKLPGGRRMLPGVFARTYCKTFHDADGQEVGCIVDPFKRLVTVLFDCQLTGQTAMTQEERNNQTAEWSAWLAGLSLAGDVEHMCFVVGTRPGTGELLAKEVDRLVIDEAPEIAKLLMQEAAETISVGIPDVVAHIALTIKVDKQTLDEESYLSQLATRLPGWYSSLAWSGILAAPMGEEEIVARVHAFFNPASEPDFEELQIAGKKHNLSWIDAGPTTAMTHSQWYEHDGCTSISWELRDAPRSTFQDTLLHGLIAPHPRIIRKRVALVYRPFEAGAGASKVEAEHRDAMVAANSSRKVVSAKAEMRLDHTEAARRAQARGAQLGRYSLYVTATSAGEETVERIIHEVEHLGAGSSLRLQQMQMQQDTGFYTSLGMGQTPWDKTTTSSVISG
ncbi:hypothetical protein GSS88_00120 [Corynebacterium sp. 3HC-13]|uniref:SCO6880 family protein n=1 Tax=Corynebacterium poyangense TaxID=2684405 RepID=UPI001CC972BC|nr:SCO6880 family protein [Corynebacterium poyangense]MBZ8176215.1 hypothetical protein [Corynebacterium poyangense]